ITAAGVFLSKVEATGRPRRRSTTETANASTYTAVAARPIDPPAAMFHSRDAQRPSSPLSTPSSAARGGTQAIVGASSRAAAAGAIRIATPRIAPTAGIATTTEAAITPTTTSSTGPDRNPAAVKPAGSNVWNRIRL